MKTAKGSCGSHAGASQVRQGLQLRDGRNLDHGVSLRRILRGSAPSRRCRLRDVHERGGQCCCWHYCCCCCCLCVVVAVIVDFVAVDSVVPADFCCCCRCCNGCYCRCRCSTIIAGCCCISGSGSVFSVAAVCMLSCFRAIKNIWLARARKDQERFCLLHGGVADLGANLICSCPCFRCRYRFSLVLRGDTIGVGGKTRS